MPNVSIKAVVKIDMNFKTYLPPRSIQDSEQKTLDGIKKNDAT